MQRLMKENKEIRDGGKETKRTMKCTYVVVKKEKMRCCEQINEFKLEV